jgi:hypothetical protein
MYVTALALFEDAMMDPDREKRQKIRSLIAQASQEVAGPSPPPVEHVSVPSTQHQIPTRTAVSKPGENPFGDGTTLLPPDFREQPLG